MDREESKWRAMFSPKPCGICGENSVALTKDGGWRCEEHITSATPAPSPDASTPTT
jgi:hypothetical protein